MGNVALILRVMPESPDVNLEELKTAIRSALPSVADIREEPIGFGLKALKLAVIVGDSAGANEHVEEVLSGLDGVERAEIIELTLT
jgi:elongation factor 1-beta